MTSVIGVLLLSGLDEQDAVDLVDLDELHLDALAARGRQVLADVVGADRKLAVAAVDEAGELDARGPAVVEERLDRGADRAAGVEDVVDEDAGLALEREVELRGADDRLRVERRLAPAADVDVVAVEGDVEGAEGKLGAASARRSAGAGAARAARRACGCRRARPLEVGVALDDLVRDADERALDRFRVEQDLRGRQAGLRQGRTEVEGLVRAGACVILDSFPASLDRVKGA